MDGISHFKDRTEAGQKLSEKLQKYAGLKNAIVYALPRGGVVTGKQIAKKLNCPLDVLIIKKIGHPLSEEYAIGAVSDQGTAVFDETETQNINQEWLQKEIEKKKDEAQKKKEMYYKDRRPIDPQDKIAIIVDDGIATGLTMMAAIKEIKNKKPKKIIIAVPVAPREAVNGISKQVDEFISIFIPRLFLGSVGAYYDEFEQVSDDEVISLLSRQRNEKNHTF